MTLRAILQIVPFGDETRTRPIHTINIHNSLATDWRGRHLYYGEIDGEEFHELAHEREDGALVLLRNVLNHYLIGSKLTRFRVEQMKACGNEELQRLPKANP